jgi:hypothetical protein
MTDDFDDFLDPTGNLNANQHELAPRLTKLDGMTLGIVDNAKTNGDKFLMMVFEELRDRYGVKDVKMIRKKELSQPALPDQLEEVAEEADFAITGIGD